MFAPYINFFHNSTVLQVLNVLYYLAYVAVPVGLVLLIWDTWLTYIRLKFFQKQQYVLLEVKLPKEIFKSPKACEFFIDNLYQTTGEATWYDKYVLGQTRAWFSLEIVSLEGIVHFYIWTRIGYKQLIEANIYSQYPGIEVYEVPDYTLPVSYDPETVGMWATEFELTKPDAYPIKTYLDYGLDKDPKEEYKIDPLTPLIEFFGSLGRGHQAWVQIIVRAHKAEDKEKDPKTGEVKMVDNRWLKGAEKEIEEIVKKAKGEKDEDGKLIPGSGRYLTDVESETIKALGRSVSKRGFDVGIRAIYTAPKDIFAKENAGGVVGGITHFNSNSLNGFKPARTAGGKYDYPWQDIWKKKTNKQKQELLDAYKRRAYFYNEFKRPYFVLNTEELATIFHFPGGVSATPTFERTQSRKSEAPVNLPV